MFPKNVRGGTHPWRRHLHLLLLSKAVLLSKGVLLGWTERAPLLVLVLLLLLLLISVMMLILIMRLMMMIMLMTRRSCSRKQQLVRMMRIP